MCEIFLEFRAEIRAEFDWKGVQGRSLGLLGWTRLSLDYLTGRVPGDRYPSMEPGAVTRTDRGQVTEKMELRMSTEKRLALALVVDGQVKQVKYIDDPRFGYCDFYNGLSKEIGTDRKMVPVSLEDAVELEAQLTRSASRSPHPAPDSP